MHVRGLLLIALVALAACNDADKVNTHTAALPATPAAEAAQAAAPTNAVDAPSETAPEAHALGSDGADETDTSWMNDIEVEQPPVWHGDQAPVRIETRHFMHGSTGLRDHYVILRAHDDVLEIQGLTLNRGNCPYSETDQVDNGVDWPQWLKFGQRKQVRAKCDQVIEAQVLTQYGEWTFSFD
jgi:hypothetical protein